MMVNLLNGPSPREKSGSAQLNGDDDARLLRRGHRACDSNWDFWLCLCVQMEEVGPYLG